MNLSSGSLTRKITLQTKSQTPDSFGQQTDSWTDYMTSVPAAINALNGYELIRAQAISSDVTHQITVRYSPKLADPLKVAAMRAVYVNAGVKRYFNITGAFNDAEANIQIDLLATEGLNQG